MTRVLDVIEDYLEWRGFSWLKLDGGTSSGERGALVHDFNDPGTSSHRITACGSRSLPLSWLSNSLFGAAVLSVLILTFAGL